MQYVSILFTTYLTLFDKDIKKYNTEIMSLSLFNQSA